MPLKKQTRGRDGPTAGQRVLRQTSPDLELETPKDLAAASLQKATLATALLTPSDVLHLQRSVGNRAVSQFLAATQPPVPQVQRQAEEEELQEKPLLQRQEETSQPTGGDLEGRLAGYKGHGSPLAEEARAFMEPRFGADFSEVRVHTGDEAAHLARDLKARAFTQGQDIFFEQGGYDPGTKPGKRLLAHELTHIVQQGGGRMAQATPAKLAGSIKRLPQAGTIQRGSSKIKGTGRKKRPEKMQLDPGLARLFQRTMAQLPALGQEEGLPLQQQVQESPYQKILGEIRAFITSGGGGRKPVWSKGDFEGQWGKGSSETSKAIAAGLEEYHTMPEDAAQPARQKGYQAEDIRKLIAKWKKTHPFGLFYKAKRNLLTKLDGQLAGEEQRLKGLASAFPLEEYCQKAEGYHNEPLPPGRKDAIEAARRRAAEFQHHVLDYLGSATIGPALLLKEQVERSIHRLKRELARMERASHKAKLPSSDSDKRRKQVEDEMDKRMAEKGLGAKTGQVSMFMTGHKLEALDPKHRDYNTLHQWFTRWVEEDWPGDTLADFFKWLEGFEVAELGAELPRTRYITTEDERKKYKLGFKGGLPFYTERKDFYRAQSYSLKQTGEERKKAEDKAKRVGNKPLTQGIYVMTPAKEFYARMEDPTRKQTFHHSSFLASLPVAAAGHMYTAGGLKIDLESGHYAPRTLQMLNAVRALEGKGLSADQFEVTPIPKDFVKVKPMKARAFLDELESLKDSKGQVGGTMKIFADRVPKVKEQLTEAYKAF
jgi:hypothetical protein